MKKLIFIFFLFFSQTILNAQTIQNEINRFVGQFAGEWTTYRLNASGDVIKAMSWKDTLTTTKPIITDSVAYVNIKSTMTFDNPNIPPYKMDFKEGLRIKKKKIISHFISVMGIESAETKIGDNTYIISQQLSPFEINQLGLINVTEAISTTVKIMLNVNGMEMHKISKITTVVWEEKGQKLTKQFVSMEGYHKRIGN